MKNCTVKALLKTINFQPLQHISVSILYPTVQVMTPRQQSKYIIDCTNIISILGEYIVIDPQTPIEELTKLCKSVDDIQNILNQCAPPISEDTIEISPVLLQEAIRKTAHLKIVKTSDVQKLLQVGYPLASKIYMEIRKKQGYNDEQK